MNLLDKFYVQLTLTVNRGLSGKPVKKAKAEVAIVSPRILINSNRQFRRGSSRRTGLGLYMFKRTHQQLRRQLLTIYIVTCAKFKDLARSSTDDKHVLKYRRLIL